ncbi:hypothetical protein J3E68DRAFT_412768 [Trichoderma sp. SZMC 28012]
MDADNFTSILLWFYLVMYLMKQTVSALDIPEYIPIYHNHLALQLRKEQSLVVLACCGELQKGTSDKVPLRTYFPKHHNPLFSSQLLASTSSHIQAATTLTCRQLLEYNKLPISVTYGNTSSSNWMPAKTSGPNKPNGKHRATAAGGDMERHLVPVLLSPPPSRHSC